MLGLLLFFVLLPTVAGRFGATPTVNPLQYNCSESGGMYSPNSTYRSNLVAMTTNLVSQAKLSGFGSDQYGGVPDTVYGLVLCRGDYTGSYCASSLEAAFQDIIEHGIWCPQYKDATVYYDQHMLRFSGDDFLLSLTNEPEWVAWNMNNVTQSRFGERVLEMMNATADYAATSTGDMYATGETWFGEQGLDMIYGLVQCTPDLTAVQCRSCLAKIIVQIRTWLFGASGYRVGGRIIGVRCNLRYEKDLFFQESKDTIKLHMPHQKGRMTKMDMMLISIAAIVIPVLLVILVRWIIQKIIDYMVQKELGDWHNEIRQEIDNPFSLYLLSTIRAATDNFSKRNKLGQGSFGKVYYGKLQGGIEIAAKRLDQASLWQGLPEFKNEIKHFAQLRHANLVRLLGCCVQRKEKILVYEYMPNRSLEDALSDPKRRESLNWLSRRRIVDGIAQVNIMVKREKDKSIPKSKRRFTRK